MLIRGPTKLLYSLLKSILRLYAKNEHPRAMNVYKDKKSRNGRLPSSKQTRCTVGSKYSCSLEHKLCYILTMAQSMKKEIRKTFGFGKEKFSAKVRLDTKMPGVPIILSKSVYEYY